MFQRELMLLVLGAAAFAQTTGTATIIGAISDSTGSVVVGAKVTCVNTGTSFVTQSVTNEGGAYYLPNLIPGAYRLTIEAHGFKQYVRDGIILRTAETPRIDVQLEVGNVAETITVSAAASILETETAASGQVLEGQTIEKIPVFQKIMNRIHIYMPGMNVVNDLHAVGQRTRALGYTLDGLSAKEAGNGSANDAFGIVNTTLDMIQEFKLFTTGLPAEFGHHSGGLLSGVFKSGTNQLHGSVDQRYLPDYLLHRGYMEQTKRCQEGAPICNPFTQYDFNAIVGGPVYIPKLYNGKDKTFFFFGYGRHHEQLSETYIGSTPNQAMYEGDFGFGGKGLPIYDPDTTRQDASGRWIRDSFPNNRIPQSRFDPVSRKILSLNPWRAPTAPEILTANGPANNLVVPSSGHAFYNKFDVKIDHQFNPNHRIFGRYSWVPSYGLVYPSGRYSSVLKDSSAAGPSLFDPYFEVPNTVRNAVISDTYTINPTSINELRLGFNRHHRTRVPETQGKGWAAQLGIPNVSAESFPEIRGGGSKYYDFGPEGKDEQVAEDFSFQNNFTKIVGTHTIKTGYEVIRTRRNALPASFPSGIYNMGGTELPFTPNTGNAFASFLLGTVANAQFTNAAATWLPRWWSHSGYVQDDYKPLRTLTLNLGVRWSYESPFSTKHSQQSQFDPNAIDPSTGLKGAILHGGSQLAKRDLNNFQPRIGLAWNFKPRWVFRSNFGLITGDLMVNAINQNFQEYLATASIEPPPGDPRIPFKLSQGPPPFRFNLNPDGSTPFVGTNFGSRTADWYDPNMRMPYVMNWSGGVQWEFRRTWVAELLYQGSAGVGLLNNWNINVLPLDISRDPNQLETIRQQYQNFRPYPQFGGIQYFSNFGHSTYHGATVRVEKRYSTGFTLNSFYTWSKSLNNADNDGGTSGITFYNRSLEKGRANYDVHHRFLTTFTYELPWGKGHRFMNVGGWRNAIVGGWELVWVQAFQTGQPFTVSFAGSPKRYLPGDSRPIQIKSNDEAKLRHVDIGPNRFPIPAQNRYLKLDAFAYPDNFQPGTLGRNTLEAPGIIWSQASLSKEFRFRERLRFQLRFDVNNVFQNQNFIAPDSTYNAINPATFGTFATTRGSISDIGNGRWHGIMVFRVEW